MKKTSVVLFITIGLSVNLIAQKHSTNSTFVSLYAGGLAIQSENFTDIYQSNYGIIVGGGLGIPIYNSLSLDGSLQYYQKEANYKSIADLESDSRAVLKQLILFAGFQYKLITNGYLSISLLSGITIALVDEERVTSSGSFIYEIEGSGNFGVYGGANFELSLGQGPIAIFGNLKYVYSWNPILKYDGNYNAINTVAGIKLYLTNRWK